MNKMFIMIPVMLAARKLDGEDPTVVYWLRIAYFSVQAIIATIVFYTYYMATQVAKGKEGNIIYVPPPPQPFADPNETKKKFTETTFAAHVLSQARTLLGSTLFSIALTTGLHYYRGMVIGLAIQAVMGPFNLIENQLVIAFLWGGGLKPGAFGEKKFDELTPNDEIVDDSGNALVRNNTTSTQSSSSLETIMLDTWDGGTNANVKPLLEALNRENSNFKTKQNGWTPLMILAGLSVPNCAESIAKIRDELGGNPGQVDEEGWNALHWAAFHGNATAAKELLKGADAKQLLNVKDKDGKTPLDHAIAEKNDDVVPLLKEKATETETTKDEGLRKRK